MFTVDEPTAEAIRQAFNEGGELSGIIEFKRRFPLIGDHDRARVCMHAIVSWDTSAPAAKPRPPVSAPHTATRLAA